MAINKTQFVIDALEQLESVRVIRYSGDLNCSLSNISFICEEANFPQKLYPFCTSIAQEGGWELSTVSSQHAKLIPIATTVVVDLKVTAGFYLALRDELEEQEYREFTKNFNKEVDDHLS